MPVASGPGSVVAGPFRERVGGRGGGHPGGRGVVSLRRMPSLSVAQGAVRLFTQIPTIGTQRPGEPGFGAGVVALGVGCGAGAAGGCDVTGSVGMPVVSGASPTGCPRGPSAAPRPAPRPKGP